MRYTIATAAFLIASTQVTPVFAQSAVDAQPSAVSAATPLPPMLIPDAKELAADEALPRVSLRRVFVSAGIGTLAGAGAGLLVGSMTTDGCQRGEEWCILSWEEEVAIHGVAGAMVGAGVGALYGLLTIPRQARTEPAPLTVAPAPGGSLTVSLTLRH